MWYPILGHFLLLLRTSWAHGCIILIPSWLIQPVSISIPFISNSEQSVVNTNKNNMELFCGMADMLGEGLPLLYLFVVTHTEAPPGTKETVLVNWMESLNSCGITPEFTLSNKDQCEINALNRVWPRAKHQLCLWHVLRALKRRLANNREPPMLYRLAAATQKFEFIDHTFVPLGQMSAKDKVCMHTSCIWPAPLTCYRQPFNLYPKGHNTQSSSSSKAIPQSILKISLQILLLAWIKPCCYLKN